MIDNSQVAHSAPRPPVRPVASATVAAGGAGSLKSGYFLGLPAVPSCAPLPPTRGRRGLRCGSDAGGREPVRGVTVPVRGVNRAPALLGSHENTAVLPGNAGRAVRGPQVLGECSAQFFCVR